MKIKSGYFSLFLSIFLLLPINQANILTERSIKILDDQVFFSLGPTDKEIDQTLLKNFPNWGNFEQVIGGESEPSTVGEIVEAASLGGNTSNLNPAVVLISLGVELDWELPLDNNLYSLSLDSGRRLYYFWHEWENPENSHLRAKYPDLENAATYALYAYFNHDNEKVLLWHQTYEILFKEDSSQPPAVVFSRTQATDLQPFLRLPFNHPENSFATVNSFFDHKYPIYDQEAGGDASSLYRFDGEILDNAAFNDCNDLLGIACYSGHDGLDYNTPLGEPILAAANGEVLRTIPSTGIVYLNHANGLLTIYRHLDTIDVDEGDIVSQGQKIGGAGNRGTGGVHLHFEVQYLDNIQKNIDPFGWWSGDSDPWSEYPTVGQVSNWLWRGDEAGDGYLTVDNRESQAQFFLYPGQPPTPPNAGWYYLEAGYKGEAWYTFLKRYTDLYKYWAVWGTYVEESGEYEVQAYWPGDPGTNDEWLPTSNARYILYIRDGSTLRTEVLYGNQSNNPGQFNTFCKTPFVNGREECPEGDIAKFQLITGSTTVVILDNSAAHDFSQNNRIVFFDAIRWEKYSPPTPTPTVTPSPTAVPGQTIRVSITQNSDDAGTAPGTCAFSHPNNEVYFGACANGGDITSGFRFNNIQIPRDAIIEDAYIAFSVDGEYTAPINVNIYGEASSNPPTFSSTNTPSQRPITSAFASWNITDRWILSEKRNTPNLSMLVQEIVNRDDWNTGNSLAVIFKNAGSGSAHRRVIAIERASWDPNLHPAELVVTYRIGSTPTSTPGSGTPGGATSTPLPPTPTPTATLPPTATPEPCICPLICPQSSSPAALRMQEQETPTPIPTSIPSDSSSRSFVQAASDTSELTTLLYRVRDEVMSQSAEGLRLTDLFYTYAPNLAQVFIAEPALYDEGVLLVKSFVPGLQAMLDGNGDTVLIAEDQVTNMQAFLDELVELGDPDLQSVLQAELARRPLQSMIGMTMNDAWVYLNGYELTWLPPVSTANPYTVQSGRTIPLAFTLVDSHGNFVVDETITLQLVDSAGNVVIGPVGLGTNPANGIVIQGGKYHYNLRTKDLPAGEYTLQVFYNVAVQAEPAIWTIRVRAK